jgi:hypothetical protein
MLYGIDVYDWDGIATGCQAKGVIAWDLYLQM